MSSIQTPPASTAEADALRAYVPTETLLQIAALSKIECAECDKQNKEYEAVGRETSEIKERMKRDRARLKELDRKRKAHFARELFPRSDKARLAAWAAAAAERDSAISRGETPKIETSAECTARMEGAK